MISPKNLTALNRTVVSNYGVETYGWSASFLGPSQPLISNFVSLSHAMDLPWDFTISVKVRSSAFNLNLQDYLVHTAQTGFESVFRWLALCIHAFSFRYDSYYKSRLVSHPDHFSLLVSLDHDLNDSFKSNVTHLWMIWIDILHIVHAIVVRLKAATRLMYGSGNTFQIVRSIARV